MFPHQDSLTYVDKDDDDYDDEEDDNDNDGEDDDNNGDDDDDDDFKSGTPLGLHMPYQQLSSPSPLLPFGLCSCSFARSRL